MANDLLRNPQHQAKLSYNGFQMHQKTDFTMSVGQLLPIYYDFLQPGDKFTAQAFMNIRTQPLEQAANMSAKVRLDWFVVPLEQLFKYFGQLYYGIQDINSDHATLSTIGGTTYEPALGTTNKNKYPQSEIYSYFTYLISQFAGSTYDSDGTCSYEYYHLGVRASDSLRLMDALGFPIYDIYSSQDTETQNLVYSLWLPMAYQKIFYDYYRLTDRECNNPSHYNFDSFINSTTVNTSKLDYFFQLRYIPLVKDFRTNTFVSPLQGSLDVGSLGNTDQLFNSWLSGNLFSTGTYKSAVDPLSATNSSPTSVYGSGTNVYSNAAAYTSTVNTNSIRGMFAVEKALEITRRAAKHYDAQTLAHWGVKPPTSIAGEVLYLGSQTQPFVIGDVISTASTSSEPLGTIAGKGYSSPSVNGSSNNPVKYDGGLNCHAVVMCIACVQPEVTYTQRGVDKLNLLISPKDFVHPEFDNMGMQPYYWMQYYVSQNSGAALNSQVYGWQYAYSENKMKQNRVFAGVHNQGTLYHWVPQFDASLCVSNALPAYLCVPDYLNNALVYPFKYQELDDGNGALLTNWYQMLYVYDPFICHCEFNCSKASKMSKYSLVNL